MQTIHRALPCSLQLVALFCSCIPLYYFGYHSQLQFDRENNTPTANKPSDEFMVRCGVVIRRERRFSVSMSEKVEIAFGCRQFRGTCVFF
ncbi:hypothetical protein ACH3XW_42590 [Acanthocheilonema viteae]